MELIALNVKTSYNIGSSLNDPTRLAKKAKELGYTAIAVTDVNNLFATFKVIEAFKKENIKPIIGMELIYNNINILMYAKNYKGYITLAKISTKIANNSFNEDILKNIKDIIVIIKSEEQEKLLKEKNIIFKETYYGYQNSLQKSKLPKNKAVLTNEVRYLEKGDNYYLDFLFAIRDGKLLEDIEREKPINNQYLLNKEEYINQTDSIIEKELVEKCSFELTNEDMTVSFFEKKEQNPKEYLYNLAQKGLEKRLNNKVIKEYQERLKSELNTIIKMGFEDYFLIVWDFVRESKKRGLLIGPGKGSAGGSLVSYALGITEIDPIEYGLLFERFLNPERITMPDIDIDFPDDRRKEIIEYVKEKYGSERVGEIITFGTFGAKSAFRDVGRTLNLEQNIIDKACKYINDTKTSLKKVYAENNAFKELINSDKKLKETIKVANFIEGLPRNTSIHAAGIVISKKPLEEILPLTKNGDFNVAAYTMEYLEPLGLLKMDFLGIRNLSLINDIIESINETENKKLNFYKLPLDDKKTLRLFQEGNTNSVFQFEGEGVKNLLIKINPQSFEDIAFCNALFRPGPMESIDLFLKRKEGKEQIDYFHKDLEPILKPTLGVIIYQEQIMQIARTFAGFSYGESDILRRAMSKKKVEDLKKYREKFVQGSVEKGHSEELSIKIYDLIYKFANYGFNKSHTIAYAQVGFKMAYLKANYPKYFYKVMLTNIIGNTQKTKTLLNELKNINVSIYKPTINFPVDSYELYKDGLILPLRLIKGINKQAIDKIINERKSGEYKDLFDFLRRCYSKEVNSKIIEILIKAGVFNEFKHNQNIYLQNIDKIINYAELAKDFPEGSVAIPELDYAKEIAVNDKDVYGFYINYHPSEKYKTKEDIATSKINEYINKNITMTLQIEEIKEIKTKKGDPMAFLKASDEEGLIELTFFPKIYNKNNNLEIGDIIKIKGTIEKRLAKYNLIAENIKKLSD